MTAAPRHNTNVDVHDTCVTALSGDRPDDACDDCYDARHQLIANA